LQLGYGSGAVKLSGQLIANKIDASREGMSHDMFCDKAVKFYRQKFSRISGAWTELNNIIKAMHKGGAGYWGGPTGELFSYTGSAPPLGKFRTATFTLPDEFNIYYPELTHDQTDGNYKYRLWDSKLRRGVFQKLYGGALANNLTQALAAAIVRWQMLQVAKLGYRIVLQVYDSIVCIVPTSEADFAKQDLVRIMKTTPYWLPGGDSLPLDCEANIGESYAQV
jgi:hypothetical protein